MKARGLLFQLSLCLIQTAASLWQPLDREAFSFSLAYSMNDPDPAKSKVLPQLNGIISEATRTLCHTARKNMSTVACRRKNSHCYDVPYGEGYHCNCSHGFEGNPYIFNGCRSNLHFYVSYILCGKRLDHS